MSPTIAECLDHVRKCELCAAKTNDEQDRQLPSWSAEVWQSPARRRFGSLLLGSACLVLFNPWAATPDRGSRRSDWRGYVR
jgi:hypothetical protein